MRKIFLFLENLFDVVLDLGFSISSFLIMFLSIIVTVTVVLRYFFGISLPVTYELVEYSMLFFTMLAAPSLFRSRKHIRMELFLDKIKDQHKKIFLNLLTNTTSLLVSAIITFFGITLTIDQFIMNRMEIRALKIPFGFILIAVPFGFLLITFQLMRENFKLVSELRKIKE